MNQKLYEDLADLRARLKFKYMDNGRMPVVCTDEALRELARKAPRHKKELEYISGLGRVFVEKYGDEFMVVLDAHNNRDAATKTLTHDVRMTLKNLETRLINVNKRNRLLYQPKLSDKTAVDLFSGAAQNKKILDMLLSASSGTVKLCDLGDGREETKKFYKRLVTLYREAQRTVRESGQLDLYVGYPYVTGKINGADTFDVRAPLALFPAELVRGVDGFSLKIDDQRDVLFNNNLVLCQYKMNNISRPLPANTAEKESRKSFKEEIERFYAEEGIKVEVTLGEAEKFREYAAGEFPRTEAGVFTVQGNVVLGRFSLYSSAMQRDFGRILEQQEINDNLYHLLDKEGAEDMERQAAEISEEKLFYIADLNYSQEKAVAAAAEGSIVIQGPPGTGKSQAIVSIISNAVNNGKTVLMVSQKKAAVDVIYSRLGHLGRYALFIDDAKNKEAFYRQIDSLLTAPNDKKETQSDFAGMSRRIEKRIERLDGISKQLFTPHEDGTVFGKVFAENALNTFAAGDYGAASKIEPLISGALRALSYAEIKACRALFSDDTLLGEWLEYLTLLEQYPFLADLKLEMGRLELYNLKSAAESFATERAAHKRLWLFKRLKNRVRLKKELREILKRFFTGKRFFKMMFKKPELFSSGAALAERFLTAKQETATLTARDKEYGAAVYRLVRHGAADRENANQKTYEILAFLLMEGFIKTHPACVMDAGGYNEAVSRICADMELKRKMSGSWMRDKLHAFADSNILTAKRLNEMKRAAESKRKPSVQRFVEKFSFELFKGIKIWIMTTDTVSEVLPCEELFDTVIFDEASQIYIEKTVPSFARAKTAVISGDHKQLRPSSLGVGRTEYEDESEEEAAEENAALEEESLLDLTRFKFPEVMLNYHYRSRYRELIEFSNRVFYGGRLFTAPNCELPPAPPIEVRKVDGLWVNRQNRAEAEEVVRLVRELFASRQRKETIGIVTFNSAQRDLVTDLLDAEAAGDAEFGTQYLSEQNRTDNGEDRGLFVKNIENVQGDERDIMIFSIAYAKTAKDGRVVRNYGWLNNLGGENRLNVAVTRAKSKIYIITSVTPEQLVTDDLANEGPKIFKKYLEYAYAVSGGSPDRINAVLESLGDEQERAEEQSIAVVRDALNARLSAAGFEVKKDIRVGDYKIDLAVTDGAGKFLLGVEIDSSVYGRGGARERDVHRCRYLGVKGWKIHRVFSMKFDLEREFEAIVSKLNK